MAKKHINIPIFIPHLGCPNTCVFCNQRTISGVQSFDISDVRRQINEALSTVGPDVEREIAFFGGSFTGIDRDLMISLLEISREYLDLGLVNSVRCSTRPDYINEEILDILERYGVGTVELGLQSTSETVLARSKRGHGFAVEREACRLIVERDISLIGQMMIGLPGSTLDDEIATAQFIIDSGAVGARIYPTVVFTDTELCRMARAGEYIPLDLDDAVARSAAVFKLFCDSKINVVRIGLCASENLSDEKNYFAGPNHPALGELVLGESYYISIKKQLEALKPQKDKTIIVQVARGQISKAIGQKKKNRLRLLSDFGIADIRFVENDVLDRYNVVVEAEERTYKCI